MFRLKKGFTLIEILITLSITGIIASLLIPQFVNNTKKNQYGATLGRAVQQIELGVSNILQDVNNNITDSSSVTTLDTITVQDLTGEEPIDEDLEDGIPAMSPILSTGGHLFFVGQPYFGIKQIDPTVAKIYYENGNTNFSENDVYLFQFDRFNAYVMYTPQRSMTSPNDIYTILAIDVNGSSKPNKTGKDIFGFGITTSGKLIPAGTAKVNSFTKAGANYFGSVPLADSDSGCPNGEIKNGWACTARVVQNGFKID